MRPIIDKIRLEPALAAALVLAVIQAVALPDAWAKVLMAALALAAGGAVRSQVTPVVKLLDGLVPPGLTAAPQPDERPESGRA